MNIFVTKLNRETTDEDLRELFENYGTVGSSKIIIDRETGRSKCFGFVEMPNDDEAREAIENLNETDFQNFNIVVKKANPKPNNEGRDSRNNYRR